MNTQIDNRKQNAQILIESANGGSFTINTKGLEITGRGVKTQYDNGYYEVTSSKLENLKKQYHVECNF